MLIKFRYLLFVIPFLGAIIFQACNRQNSEGADVIPGLNSPDEKMNIRKDEDNTVTCSVKAILQTENITCPGFIDVPPNNKAFVTIPFEGIISEIMVNPGQFIEKGAPVASLVNPEYIKIQEAYLSVKSELKYYKEEFKRQGQLTIEKAAPIKKMQQAEADYLSREARFLSLKQQLRMLNLAPESISHENMQSTIRATASISGYIARLNAQPGKYIRPGDTIAEIYNTQHLYLTIHLPGEYLHYTKNEKHVSFFLVDDTSKRYTASITNIARIANREDHSIPVFASIDQDIQDLRPNMMVKVLVGEKESNTYLIPKNAVINDNGEFFLRLKKEQSIERISVTAIPYNDDYMEILHPSEKILDSRIVLQNRK